MKKISIFKFIITIFLLLNFATLIFGYVIFKDFSNSEKAWYQNQINLNLKKEELILNNIDKINQSSKEISLNLLQLELDINDLKSELNIVTQNNSVDNSQLTNLNLELATLKSEESKLNIEKSNLYDQYLREQQRKASKVVVATTSSS